MRLIVQKGGKALARSEFMPPWGEELTDEQIRLMRTEEKGETTVRVAITDGEGKEPVMAEMIWAWTPTFFWLKARKTSCGPEKTPVSRPWSSFLYSPGSPGRWTVR